MALTLGDVEPKKKKTAKKKVARKKTVKKAKTTKTTKAAKSKTRPWQSPDLDFTEPQGPQTGDFASDAFEARKQRRQQLQEELVKEWLMVAEEFKNTGINSLPEPLGHLVKESWLGKVQLAPMVKIPIPEFFRTKTKA